MTEYAVGVIGTGMQRGGTDDSGMAMGYQHADAYAALDECEVVACADLVRENAERFAAAFSIDDANVYDDHGAMLREVNLDIVSVTTPIPTHPEVVLDCVAVGNPEAIHCEKPMSNTWGDSRLMAQECARRDIQLTFNHQLRFAEPVRRAKELLDEGAIGDLMRVEMSRGNLLEAGTHQMDLCSYFSGDLPAEWVLGGLDYREAEGKSGVHVEDQTLGLWQYENGVHGLASTGDGADAVGCHSRLIGTEGTIEVDRGDEEPLRVQHGGEWEAIDCEPSDPLSDAITHVVECLDTGTEPVVSARNALVGTELIFGIYESARRRGRVDLPLTIDDNPMQAMVDAGDL